MKKFLAVLLIGLSLIAFSADASAARLGGGMSFGRSMTVPTAPRVAPRTAPGATRAAPGAATRAGTAGAAGAATRGGMGRGLLLGAATALGFVAIAHMFGLGEGFAQFLMLIVLVIVAMYFLRLLMPRRTPAKYSGQARGSPSAYRESRDYEPMQKSIEDPFMGAARPGSAMDEFTKETNGSSFDVPPEFDKENFLNMASSYFTMLQKAWDSGDMDSLSNYCTDEVFIELTHRRREIKGVNVTKVVSLNSSLAGFETTDKEYIASVLFQGNLVENGVPTRVKEIWNLVKPKEGNIGWLLAGIQQA